MMADYYNWFPVLHSGADSEMFHRVALYNQTASEWRIRTYYTNFLTIIYKITDSSRLIAQYINVLFGLGVMIFVQRSLSLLEIDKKIQKWTMIVVSLLPNLIIFSGILLREAWIEFFVAASVFYFIRWYKNASSINLLLCIFMVLFASIMHSGIIILLLGYSAAFLTYNPKSKRVHFSGLTIMSLILLSGLFLLFMNYSGVFIAKFGNYDFDDPNAFIELSNRTSSGESAYLTWVNVNSVSQGLLFSPIKMVYFLFSPLPTEWYRISDIVGFCIDSVIYLCLCIGIIKFNSLQRVPSILRKYFVFSLLVTVFIFAYGTYNAGSAFRHRAKIFPLIAVTYAISAGYSKNKIQINEKNI